MRGGIHLGKVERTERNKTQTRHDPPRRDFRRPVRRGKDIFGSKKEDKRRQCFDQHQSGKKKSPKIKMELKKEVTGLEKERKRFEER